MRQYQPASHSWLGAVAGIYGTFNPSGGGGAAIYRVFLVDCQLTTWANFVL
ncbi:hypothetical protein SPLC1_S411700 [Arthrospira platensis C1]|nr:hypothetical protein SPLC1_S411700 [Arthrospira platensis C1]MDT9235828.1 hypothetical protein [Limnospira sp. PMC 917.15]MDT9236246.1 hypothetical protein [Limnospira sp. PMC 917.15]